MAFPRLALTSAMTETPQTTETPHAPGPSAPLVVGAIWSTVAVLCGIAIMGSIFVTKAYRNRYLAEQNAEATSGRPRIYSRLEKDLNAINRDGQSVSLSQLKGSIYVLAHQYTTCPSGCLGVASRLADVYQEFGKWDGFHIVSVTVDPARDTPEKMNAFVKKAGVDQPNWWFLTGDETEIRRFMVRYAQFYGTKTNTDPAEIASNGLYAHDLRVALIDGGAHVRGYYQLYDEVRGEGELKRLSQDIRYLYQEREEARNASDAAEIPKPEVSLP